MEFLIAKAIVKSETDYSVFVSSCYTTYVRTDGKFALYGKLSSEYNTRFYTLIGDSCALLFVL